MEEVKINEIKLEERTDDIKAFLVGYPEIWGNGKTGYEAIGNLITNHQYIFNVNIILR